jgi:hypothetical protein
MSDKYILDGRGRPKAEPDLLAWARWFETADRIVCKTKNDGGPTVSTVFLGMNHNWGNGPPLLFETMIFGGEHDEYQERYATREEAIEGHERAVALAYPPPPNPNGKENE